MPAREGERVSEVYRFRWAVGLVIAASAGLLLLGGCEGGGYPGSQRAAVSGKVTFDGAAVENGILNLIPERDGTRDARKASTQIQNGAYSIPEDKGPNLGKHKVEIYWYKPTGDTSDTGEDEGQSTVQVIPDKYNTQTTLEVAIVAGKNECNFDLTSD